MTKSLCFVHDTYTHTSYYTVYILIFVILCYLATLFSDNQLLLGQPKSKALVVRGAPIKKSEGLTTPEHFKEEQHMLCHVICFEANPNGFVFIILLCVLWVMAADLHYSNY